MTKPVDFFAMSVSSMSVNTTTLGLVALGGAAAAAENRRALARASGRGGAQPKHARPMAASSSSVIWCRIGWVEIGTSRPKEDPESGPDKLLQ